MSVVEKIRQLKAERQQNGTRFARPEDRIMGSRVRASAALACVIFISGCSVEPEPQSSLTPIVDKGPSTEGASVHPKPQVDGWHAKFSPELLELFALMEATEPTAQQEFDAAIERLRNPVVVNQLEELHRSAPSGAYMAQWKLVAVMGLLAQPESLAFLKGIASKAIPKSAGDHDNTPEDEERMIRARAIKGLGILAEKSVAGALAALNELLRSEDRATVIAAAMELNVLEKIGPEHEGLLRAKGLLPKFEKIDVTTTYKAPASLRGMDPSKPLDPEPISVDGLH